MVKILTSMSQFNQIQTEMKNSKLVALDTETTWTNLFRERQMLGLTLTSDIDTWYIPVGHQAYLGSTPENFKIPDDLFTGVTCPIVAHNMKFDFVALNRANVNLPVDNLWCTMMMAVYVDETNKGKDAGHDLDTVLSNYLGQRKKKVEQKSLLKFGWEKAPVEFMAAYADKTVSPSHNCSEFFVRNFLILKLSCGRKLTETLCFC